MEKNTEYTDILAYMLDVLNNEFPTVEFTPEYIMLSILDNPRCHANMIMDNILMTDTLDYLRNYYADVIKGQPKKPILNITTKFKFNEELTGIYDKAEIEANAMSSSKLGSEHILLAIMNPSNHFKIAEKLNSLGLSYDSMCNNCRDFEASSTEQKTPKVKKSDKSYINNNHQDNGKMPLKSEVNSKVFVQNGNTPFINKYTIDLHEEIANGKYDKLVGRESILNNIITVLSRRRKNNVILVGKPGCGKTSIGYRLAEMIDEGCVPATLEGKKVVMLDVMALLSGTHLRGMFEERVDGLFKELKNNSNYILFIDDMQNIVRNTGKDKDGDLSDVIGRILTEGDVRVIGTIPFKDYRNGIENNSALSTKLQKIIVEPSSKEETLEILKSNKGYYENFHHVKFDDACLLKAVKLAKRYITNNSLPDSAIDVIDLTGASISLNNEQSISLKTLKEKLKSFDTEKKNAMNSGNFEKLDEIAKKESQLQKDISDMKKIIDNDESTWIKATEDDIADTVSAITTIPVSKLSDSNKTTILHIDEILKRDVIGQDEAINDISKAIKRSRAGFSDNNRCISLMLIGKSGVGKTLIAKKLAENVFGDEKALVRFDMSEYQDKTSVNKLLGSSAGYVGYDNGGLLTEAVKNKPYCVLLFDEIEKADESIYNVFLQLFDEGRLTDNNGTTVNFKNVIVIMTSNVGAKQASELGNGVGFQSNEEENKKAIIEKSLKNKFNPEFLNRIDKIIHFNSLTDENIKTITALELDKLTNRVKENGVNLTYNSDVVDYVFKKAIREKEYGARPVMRIIQDNISDKIVDMVLESDKNQNSFDISIDKYDEVTVKRR